jgi:S-formylglutathione hydrolase FrmB
MNQINGEAYYTYISKELPARISEFFNVSPKREDRFIAGLSMGGYGALKIGLKNSDLFCAAAAMSAVANIRSERWKTHLENLIGKENYLSDEEDLFAIAKEKETDPNRPRLFMWCGTEDWLYADNVALRDHIQQLDYDYLYEESPGTHCWDCWDVVIQRILQWMFEPTD